MKRFARLAFPLVIAFVFGVVVLRGANKANQQQNNTPMSFTGEIMDSACGALGSHAQMMKKEGLKTAKECTQLCVKNGSTYVLYVAANRTVYHLDDQDKPIDYAGERVTIVGTYNGSTKSIHIQSIQAVP
ncbi:MAG: hypothetical protein ACRD4S_13760 [Candidatus Acidiferrales bacterium]